jgi:hypothetical protein
MNVIKKIFRGVRDKEVHQDFIRFGKGEFDNRYLINARKQKTQDKYTVKTSSEFANYLVKRCLSNSEEVVKVSGIIISTYELDFDFPIKNKKKYMGIIKYIIDEEIEKEKLISLMDEHPRIFYGLSFSNNKSKLKIKKKAPKSGKPSSKGPKKRKANFCTLKTRDKSLVKDLIFDYPNFQEISISHKIIVDSIKYPDNLDDLKPNEIREKAKRKGKIIREVSINGKDEEKERDFLA